VSEDTAKFREETSKKGGEGQGHLAANTNLCPRSFVCNLFFALQQIFSRSPVHPPLTPPLHNSAMRWAIPLSAALALLMPIAASATPTPITTPDPATLCDAAIARAERTHTLPAGLLGAIGRVESGRRDPFTGALHPWPWTIDVEGEGHTYQTESQAIAAVRQFQAQGRRSIDVGCMQVNLVQHPDAFPGLGAAFDPVGNAEYAADLLTQLRQTTPDWISAAGLYHSATPALGLPYRLKVEAALQAAGAAPLPFAPGRALPATRLAMAMPTPPAFGGGGFHTSQLRAPSAAAPAPAGHGLAFYRALPVRRAR
jgi:hypothetical protein